MNRLLFFLCVCVILSNCNKSEELPTPAYEPSPDRITFSKFSLSEQREEFAKFSTRKKADLWKNKLEQVLNSEIKSSKQKELLLALYMQINEDIFIESSPQNIEFKTNFEPQWKKDGLKSFTFPQLRAIATSLDDVNLDEIELRRIIDYEDGPADDFYCSCSESSDWCWDPKNCTGTCYVGSSNGCGTLWVYRCNGVCVE